MDKYYFPAKIINQRAVTEGAGWQPKNAVTWSAEISSNRLDAYFGHMADSTLRNFADDAAAGVAFLDSHNARQLGYGQSTAGVFWVEGEISRTLADFYTVPGINFGSAQTYRSTDDFIRALEARLVRDVSVGFYGGDLICDICGNSLYDWRNCSHWPGVEYAVGDQGDKTVVATFEVVDARLAEVSAVYDGATPEAMVSRAQEMSAAGLLEPEMGRRLEMQYRIKLPAATRVVKPAATPPERTIVTMDELEQIRSLLGEVNATGETALDQVRWLIEENARLVPLADQGREYRRDLVEQALAEGVRALGEAFPVETYRSMLERASLEQIREIERGWERQAAARFPGGRQSQDSDTPVTAPPSRMPAAAHKA